MNNQITKAIYDKLFNDISSLYETTRLAIVKMYWSIGQYIIVVEQKNNIKAPFGKKLLFRLSKDLSVKYGKGFSMTNLRNMRLFYRTYPIHQISDELEWSNYVALLTVKDPEKKESNEQDG